MISRRASLIQLSTIKEIELAAARVPGAVSLAQGIPSFDTPEVIKTFVQDRMAQGLTAKYSLTPGMLELREAVAESLVQEGMRYDPDGEIIITAGSIEAITATLLTLTEPGDEVIIPSPTYASYQQVIRIAGCEPKFVPLDEERNFDLDVEAIARKITPRTKAIFYCNPNNPTGTIYSKAKSLRMMELAEQHGLYIITDEVYKDFLYTDEPYFSPAQVEAQRDRVVRIFSFSKAYAMTGWRVGYLHTSRRLATEILKVHDSLVTCAPVISQYAALAALEFGGDAVAEFHSAFRRRRDLTLEALDGLSHVFDYQKPNGAYFVFPRVKDTVRFSEDSRKLAMDLLEHAKVALVPGVAFGPTGESHLRISFGREEEDIEEAFQRMRAYFERPEVGLVSSHKASSFSTHPSTSINIPDTQPRRGARGFARKWAIGYLNLLARIYLLRRKPQVVAIAGNRGKTVVKRILLGLLERQFTARANPRSYNTEIGLPLAILGLEINPKDWRHVAKTLLSATQRALFPGRKLELLVLELGTRQPGDMATLLRTVHPDWAIITPIAGEGGQEPADPAVLQEELALLANYLPGDRVLIHAEDELLKTVADQFQPAPMNYGESQLKSILGGYTLTSAKGAYQLGKELVGSSSLGAVYASVLLGEKLDMNIETLTTYLHDIAGQPSATPLGNNRKGA